MCIVFYTDEIHSGNSSVSEPHTRNVNVSEPHSGNVNVSEAHSGNVNVSEPTVECCVSVCKSWVIYCVWSVGYVLGVDTQTLYQNLQRNYCNIDITYKTQ